MKMKRFMAGSLALGMLALTGCGGGASDDGSSPGSDVGTEAEYTVIIGDAAGSQTKVYETWVEGFIPKLEEVTGGRMTAQVYTDGTLVNGDADALDKVSENIAQMTWSPPFQIGENANIPQLKICDIPYMFETTEEVYAVYEDAEIMDPLREQVLEKLDVLMWNMPREQSFLWLGNTKQEIRTPEDLKNLKIRTQTSDVVIDTIEGWGGSATPMAFSEVYTGLQQGTIDGVLVNMATLHAIRWTEYTKYLTAVDAGVNLQYVVVNNSWYESLPDDLREQFTEVCDWYVEFSRKETADYIYGEYLDEMADSAEIYYPTESEMEQWRAVKQPLLDKYADQFGGKAYLDLVQSKIDAVRNG